MEQVLSDDEKALEVPRSIGAMTLSTKTIEGRTGIDRFRTFGATKVAFPRRDQSVEAIMLNTSGGLTGGDRFDNAVSVGADSHLVLTTQAAERAYRSMSGAARVRTRMTVAPGARLFWLPQELIFFDGASLERRLDLDIADGAEAVLVEPVIFGRAAMGETRVSGTLDDRITIRTGGRPLVWDRIRLTGRISAELARPAIANGMAALASVFYIGPRAHALLDKARAALTCTGGASLIAERCLTVRCLAPDSFLLRRALVPLLECLTAARLPKSWSL